jgi:hypothetical protein
LPLDYSELELAARARFRRRAQGRLPVEVRKQFLDALYAGKPFKTAIRDFALTHPISSGDSPKPTRTGRLR